MGLAVIFSLVVAKRHSLVWVVNILEGFFGIKRLSLQFQFHGKLRRNGSRGWIKKFFHGKVKS